MMPHAYSYIRMSTLEQMKGDSIRRQLKASEDYAKKHGLELMDIMHDCGVSAFAGENAEMGKLANFLDLAEAGRIAKGSYLIVESLDRITRTNLIEAISLLNKIVGYGIVLVTLVDEQIYSAETVSKNPMAMIMAAMVLMRAHEESRTKSMRLGAVWENKRTAARAGHITKQRIPSWLRFSEDGQTIEIIEERAEIIRDMFDLSGSGWGSFSIAKHLNEQRIPAWSRSGHWQESYIKKILSNRAVLGEYQPHRLAKGLSHKPRSPDGPPICGYYPAIIDEVVFADAQNAIARRKVNGKGRKGRNFTNLFTGLLRCKSCRSGMRFIDKGPPPKGGRYLRCSRAVLTQDCSSPAFRYDIVEAHLFRLLTTINFDAIINSPAWMAKTAELRFRLVDLDAKEAKLQKQLENVADAIAASGYSEALSSKLKRLELDLEKIQRDKRTADEELAHLSLSSGLDYKALVENLNSPIITDSERSALRRKFSSELGRLVSRIEIGRSFPTPGDDIPDQMFEGLTLTDLGDANRFIEIMVLYKTYSFTEFDAFTGERTHFEMNSKMNVLMQRESIKRA